MRKDGSNGRRVPEQAAVRGRRSGCGIGGHVRRDDGLHGRGVGRGGGRGRPAVRQRRRRGRRLVRADHVRVAAGQLLVGHDVVARGHRRSHPGGLRAQGRASDHHRLQRGHRGHRLGQGADGAPRPRGLRAGQQEELRRAGGVHEQRRGRRPGRGVLLQPHLRAHRGRRRVQERQRLLHRGHQGRVVLVRVRHLHVGFQGAFERHRGGVRPGQFRRALGGGRLLQRGVVRQLARGLGG